jgi:hypothetical protein
VPSSFGTLRGAVRNRDLPHAHHLQFGFVVRRVEPCVASYQLWNTPELLFMLVHCRHPQVRIRRPLLEHFVVGDDLVLRFLNLNHLPKLGRLTRFPLADHFRTRLKHTHQFPRYMDVSTPSTRALDFGSLVSALTLMKLLDHARTHLVHEEPTFLLTNQLRRSARELVGRYAKRMLIENGIADGIDFFHMDALSSAVAIKVDCDLQLTLMASSLYRLLAPKLQNGYQRAARVIFSGISWMPRPCHDRGIRD